MVVVKPLYSIIEVEIHWWTTYSRYHKEKLEIVTLTYDPCLLVTDNSPLGIVGMQTDDTVILRNRRFNNRKSQKIVFKSKTKIELKKRIAITFNESITTRSEDNIVTIKQKKQGKKLLLVDILGDIK
jgi:hypothetical protein